MRRTIYTCEAPGCNISQLGSTGDFQFDLPPGWQEVDGKDFCPSCAPGANQDFLDKISKAHQEDLDRECRG